LIIIWHYITFYFISKLQTVLDKLMTQSGVNIMIFDACIFL